MADEKYGLYEQLLIACTQPSKYKLLLNNGKKRLISYLLFLVMLLVIIENVIPFTAWNYSVGGIDNLITERLPEFELKDGTFTIAKPVEIALSGVIYISADSSVDKIEKSDLKDDYATQMVVGKTNLFMENGGQIYSLDFSSLKNVTLTNQDLLDMIPELKLVLAITFAVLYLMKLVSVLFFTFFYTLMGSTGFRKQGNVLTFKEVFVLAIYAGTIGNIASSINSCAGYPLDTYIIAILVVAVTMYLLARAQKAIISPKTEG